MPQASGHNLIEGKRVVQDMLRPLIGVVITGQIPRIQIEHQPIRYRAALIPAGAREIFADISIRQHIIPFDNLPAQTFRQFVPLHVPGQHRRGLQPAQGTEEAVGMGPLKGTDVGAQTREHIQVFLLAGGVIQPCKRFRNPKVQRHRRMGISKGQQLGGVGYQIVPDIPGGFQGAGVPRQLISPHHRPEQLVRAGGWELLVPLFPRRIAIPPIQAAGGFCAKNPFKKPGKIRFDTIHALRLGQEAKALGVDAVLTVTPYYNKTTQQGLLRHYLFLAEGVELPMLLYNVPSRTGMSFRAETYAALAEHPNIYGVKEASGDFGLILRTRALCPEDFALYSGNDDQIVPILALGGLGVISTAANVVPAELHALCDSFFRGDLPEARAIQQPLIQALFLEVNPIPVKAALAAMGRMEETVRMPLTTLGPAARRALEQAMDELSLR